MRPGDAKKLGTVDLGRGAKWRARPVVRGTTHSAVFKSEYRRTGAGMKNDGYRVHCFEEDDDDDPCRKVEKRMLGCCLPRPRRTNVSRNAMGSLLASSTRYAFCEGAVVGSLRPTSYSTVNREDKDKIHVW